MSLFRNTNIYMYVCVFMSAHSCVLPVECGYVHLILCLSIKLSFLNTRLLRNEVEISM